MREYRKHRSRGEEIVRLFIKGAGVLLLLIVTYTLVRAAWDMFGRMASASEAKLEANSELADVENQQKNVSGTLHAISTARGEEAQIRERFGVAKQGEGVIVIVRDKSATSTEEEPQETWWTHLLHTLFVW